MSPLRIFPCIAVLISLHAFAQAPKSLAYGQYTAVAGSGKSERQLDDWTLEQDDQGNYLVKVSPGTPPANGAHIVQEFGFLPRFLPISYALKATAPALEPGAKERSIHVDCRLGEKNVNCTANFEGDQSSAAIDVAAPYLFFPGEFSGLDFPWFLTGVANQTKAQAGAITDFAVTMLDDSKDDPLKIALKFDKKQTVSYLGSEYITVLHRKISAKKLKTSTGTTLWLSDSGLLLAFQFADSTSRVELTQYERLAAGAPELR
jgi:hypothetical protein